MADFRGDPGRVEGEDPADRSLDPVGGISALRLCISEGESLGGAAEDGAGDTVGELEI